MAFSARINTQRLRKLVVSAIAFGFTCTGALAGEESIRKALAGRLKDFPKIDEIRKMPVPGLYEVRAGNAIYYADENGDHLIAGSIFDTKTQSNLTEARNKSLAAADFSSIPRADAVTTKRGSGARHLIVFADPNCGFCKKLEVDLAKLNDVTIHTVLYPILGPDSVTKSRDVFCAKESGAVWTEWMRSGRPIPPRAASCSAVAIERNIALGRRLNITGTPAMMFEDGSVLRGAADLTTIERHLQAGAGKG
ncbi:DsbC family protein [Variovorax sp. LT1P1]|uniref:DsbC family protein n=1 Tax=Variovorax sp. LT1P1 TaxID=3443730 RepID=UPI003F455163